MFAIDSTKLEDAKKSACESENGSRKLEEGRKNPLKFILKIKIKPSRESCKLEDQKALFKGNDASHDKVREIFLEVLQKVVGEVDGETKERVKACDPIGGVVSIETEMFKKIGQYNGAKKLKYKSIMFQHKGTKQSRLEKVKPERLKWMNLEEMASDEK
ncbi:transcription elongation factor TFIIS-like [Mangifera indica]|uniref:transcription elongation factor TFIIS-like n=1 Tax=Mangifera indica TaxID=29780 RepID=UPI001CFB3F62|nr:transcription elongation factor TFIIS-like [Mangifera indica]